MLEELLTQACVPTCHTQLSIVSEKLLLQFVSTLSPKAYMLMVWLQIYDTIGRD